MAEYQGMVLNTSNRDFRQKIQTNKKEKEKKKEKKKKKEKEKRKKERKNRTAGLK
jgi:hypothetical protein